MTQQRYQSAAGDPVDIQTELRAAARRHEENRRHNENIQVQASILRTYKDANSIAQAANRKARNANVIAIFGIIISIGIILFEIFFA